MTLGVARFSKPARRAVSGYLPYVLKCQWTDRELNPDFRHARAVSSRWTISPFVFQWTAWESNPGTDRRLVHRPCKGQSPPTACRPVCCSERSVRESNPVSVLTTDVCSRNTYRPFLSSDPGWNRTTGTHAQRGSLLHVTQASSPLDHGIVSVTRVGVEPTKSPRPQRDRFACLRTWSRVAGPGVAPGSQSL